MRLCILGSGSSGNAALVQTENARILVDMGLSIRRLKALLHDIGESLDRIDGIFITHEHGDHVAGLEGLKRHPSLPVFANAATARAAQRSLGHPVSWRVFQTGDRFHFKDLEIESFSIPHDAVDPVGYIFHSGQPDDLFAPRRSLGWVTDLGHAPAHVRERIRDVDVLVVESNHCPRMLEADARRPWSLKQRISGRHGHLSNQAARELLLSVAGPRWQRIFLAHLSRECNTPEAVQSALAEVRVPLSIVTSGGGTPFYDFT